MMLKRWIILMSAVGLLCGCQSLINPQDVQAELLDFYPRITSVTLNDYNLPVIAWDNPSSQIREIGRVEIYIQTPKMSAYPMGPTLISTSNMNFFTSKLLFHDGLGLYKFKMRVVDTDDVPGSFSDEFSAYFSGFQKSIQILDDFGIDKPLDQPFDFVHDSNGNLFIADSGNSRILMLNSSGQLVAQFGSYGTGDGQFKNPQGICLDNKGHVVVSDTGNDRMVYFDPKNFLNSFRVLGSSGSALGQFDQPMGCTVLGGYLFVADVNNNRVQAFRLTNDNIVWDFSSAVIVPFKHGFVSVWDVTSYGENLVFVDKGAHKVFVVNKTGDILLTLGSKGTGEGELMDPRHVIYDSGQKLFFVANHGNHTVDAFHVNGDFAYRWGIHGTDQGQLYSPVSVSVYSGKAYVLERGNNRIQVFRL